MKFLDISRDFTFKGDGGSVVTERNFNLLSELGTTDSFFIPVPSLKTRMLNFICRQSYGETSALNIKLRECLNREYDFVFFDGSIYGGYLKRVSDAGFKTICFFHNVEKVYYEAKARHTKAVMDMMMVPYISHNERLSVGHASYIITLNQRDSDDLLRFYGRKADLILPSSFPSLELKSSDIKTPAYLLFVGTNFFANVEGVRFIIEKIAPQTIMPIKIVGNVNEAFKDATLPDNIEMLGRVDDISPYYRNASAVIAPIFSGSGLKTKTVEALRFGKTVLGTSEAFEGIDIANNPGIGTVCHYASDFVSAIRDLSPNAINKVSLSLFEKCYSDNAALSTLRNFLDRILQ